MKNILLIIFCLFLIPFSALAEENFAESEIQPPAIENQTYKAIVLSIEKENTLTREDGSENLQQNLKVKILDGDLKNKEEITTGIGDLDVVQSSTASVGEKVLVMRQINLDGSETFVVTDIIRTGNLLWLSIFFVLSVLIIGKWRGCKSLLSLILTFFIIMYFIIPRILAGQNPLFVSVIGASIILAIIVYVTWGWQKKSHVALLSIALSLFLAGFISYIFSKLTRLTGLANEDILFLIDSSRKAINFEGLLLAGMIIGTLGVLDDVVISQISAVEQLQETNPNLTKKQLYKKALSIGIDHISSMTNTLFLAYAGASLPLLLLFSLKSGQFVSFSQVINNEIIATEIVRTLTGSIGLILAMPLSTFIAAYFFKAKKHAK
ncbi:MAG: YibE/F family protein [Patescibacteria group bacterium]